jgi:hypothetical protein
VATVPDHIMDAEQCYRLLAGVIRERDVAQAQLAEARQLQLRIAERLWLCSQHLGVLSERPEVRKAK